MMKRVLFAFLGSLCLASSGFAQQDDVSPLDQADVIAADHLRLTGEWNTASALSLYRPDLFSTVNGSLLIHELPALTLLDGRRFPISGNFGQVAIAPIDLMPVALLRSVSVRQNPSPAQGSEYPGGVVDLHRQDITSGGELGLFYGTSGGKHGREEYGAYIFGGVGTENLHISAGADYQHSSGRGVYIHQ